MVFSWVLECGVKVVSTANYSSRQESPNPTIQPKRLQAQLLNQRQPARSMQAFRLLRFPPADQIDPVFLTLENVLISAD